LKDTRFMPIDDLANDWPAMAACWTRRSRCPPADVDEPRAGLLVGPYRLLAPRGEGGA
jgi:hypothetical protein